MKNNSKVLLFVIAISLFIVCNITVNTAKEMDHNPEYTAYNKAVLTSAGVFYMENWNNTGYIYLVNDTGNVLAMTTSKGQDMEQARVITASVDGVYALYSTSTYDESGTFDVYAVARYDSRLKLTGITDLFYIEDPGVISALNIDNQGNFNITSVGFNGEYAKVISLPAEAMRSTVLSLDEDASEEEAGDKEYENRYSYLQAETIVYREKSPDRLFVDGCYMNSELFILTDGEVPQGVFAPDKRIKAAVDKIHFTFGQNLRLYSGFIFKLAGAIIIIAILAFLSYRLILNRNRIVYLFIGSELIFLVLIFVCVIFVKNQYYDMELEHNVRYAKMILQDELRESQNADFNSDDFYDSPEYYDMQTKLKSIVTESEDYEAFFDAFILRESDGVVLVDANGHNRTPASYMYGGELTSVAEKLKKSNVADSNNLRINGEKAVVIACDGGSLKNDMALVLISYNKERITNYIKDVLVLVLLFGTIFLIGSFLIALLLYFQHVDIKTFSTALKDLALNGEKINPPDKVSRDMREMWQSYGELAKKIEQINYDKYKIFEAYYRFAPKGIEKIMGKDSIYDVKSGDVVTLTGSLMILAIDKEENIEKKVWSLTNILENMERYTDQSEGILVTKDESLSLLRFLFLQDDSEIITKIVQFLHSGQLGQDAVSVLLYKDEFVYGVAGAPNQSLTYFDSDYSGDMDDIASFFREMGVPLVVTSEILNETNAGEVRYIGRWNVDNNSKKLRFFEVLDAYPAKERQNLIANREKFDETLKLFFSKDYYLARSQFMTLLKECPNDSVVRWYIFECEKLMKNN